MNQLRFTLRFRLDYRRNMRRGCDLGKLKSLLALLRRGAPLPLECRDTAVKGTAARACRVEPGWLLLYQMKGGMVTLLRMKYSRKDRPKAAPPMGLWFRTLLRSPVKTALTVLLLAAAAFLLLDNLSSYAMQTEAIRQAEEKVEGVLTVERRPVSEPVSGERSWFLLTELGESWRNRYTYETQHHAALTPDTLDPSDDAGKLAFRDLHFLAGLAGVGHIIEKNHFLVLFLRHPDIVFHSPVGDVEHLVMPVQVVVQGRMHHKPQGFKQFLILLDG